MAAFIATSRLSGIAEGGGSMVCMCVCVFMFMFMHACSCIHTHYGHEYECVLKCYICAYALAWLMVRYAVYINS